MRLPLPRLAVLLLVSAAHCLPHAQDSCRETVCRAGRECVPAQVGGAPQCLCVTSCPDHDRPVCGSDGLSYDNFCLLHQRACLTGEHISVDYRGYCKADIAEAMRAFGVTQSTTAMPLVFTDPPKVDRGQQQHTSTSGGHHLSVCYGPQRDALRDSTIAKWQQTLSSVSWYLPHMTYMEGLPGHFHQCDEDNDRLLRPDEVLHCLKEVPFRGRAEQDTLVTKTLCIDAMMEEVDTNKDWKLNAEEFANLFNPMSQLVAKNCSLEGATYTDGAEVKIHCNHCVCATGSWVCATNICDKKSDHDEAHERQSENSSKDIFGYLDTKYDLNDNRIGTEELGEDDEDESYRTEEAKREFDLLSEDDKQVVTRLENKIRDFYHRNHITTSTAAPSTTTEDEDLVAREDEIVEQYDELLQRSRRIRQKLQGLRDSLSELEHEKQDREYKHVADHHHADLNTIEETTTARPMSRLDRKYKKYEAYRQARISAQQHNRQLNEVDNHIWEDQWKAKVGHHAHRQPLNHNHL